ncbi:glycosyltransferase [Thermogemmatispora carboxidivorans]|uniref:glycosyltransferase n=1 Tax=Thermogemmatispora carboxidivorans TaxID=1382306 RepID=UPI00069B0051|nr:glycosyltransferase family 2 protein [Thermogemmatispora carboxidivorans]
MLHSAYLCLTALGAGWQLWRVRRTLRETAPPVEAALPNPAPHVSIIVPVRNEEQHIGSCLASLLAQDYPDFEVFVVDDGSTDATPALLAIWQQRNARLRVYRVEELPAGWAGKAHALHTGVSLTRGEWLLFTDADTLHAPDALRRMMAHAQAQQLDFLSMLTDARLVGSGSRLLTPAGIVLMTHFATPGEMRNPQKPGRALAVGHYLLVRRSAYEASGGYSAPELRSSFGDDVGLAQFLKRQGCREDFVDGRDLVSNEQWTTWRSAWRGWRKSVYSVTASAPLLCLGAGLGLISYGLLPLLSVLTALRQLLRGRQRERSLPLLLPALLTLALQVSARRSFEREQQQPFAWSLLAPVGWIAFGLLMLDTVRLALSGRGAEWKGRQAPRQPSSIQVLGLPLQRLGSARRR